MSPPLFSSSRITDPRYVWDPTVHKYFGEDLYFFILRLENATTAPLKVLETACREAGVASYCVYKLYGYYDALIRLWTNGDGLRELREQLAAMHLRDDPIEFHVNRAYYDDWSAHLDDVDDRYLSRYERDIETVAQTDGVASSINQAVHKLRDARLVHYLDPRAVFARRDFPLIKFYCTLSRARGNYTGNEMAQIREAASQLSGVRLKSLYFGAAPHLDVDCLLKGVIASHDYPMLDGWIDDLYDALHVQGQEFQRMTLIIANTESREADVVDTRGAELGPRGQRLRRLVGARYGAMLLSLPAAEQNAVIDVFDEFRLDSLNTPFERYFLGICEARIGCEEELLEEKLTFLQRLEAAARGALIELLFVPQLGAKGWHGKVSSVAQELMSQKRRRARAVEDGPEGQPLLGLGEFVEVSGELEERGQLNTAAVRSLFGDSWASRLREAIELRNVWAHGSLGKALHKDGSWEGWPEIARRACRAGSIYSELVAHGEEA